MLVTKKLKTKKILKKKKEEKDQSIQKIGYRMKVKLEVFSKEFKNIKNNQTY